MMANSIGITLLVQKTVSYSEQDDPDAEQAIAGIISELEKNGWSVSVENVEDDYELGWRAQQEVEL